MFAGRRSRLRAVFGLHSRGAPYATAPRDNNKRIAVGKIGKYVPVRPHHFDRYLIRPAGWCERLVGTATVWSAPGVAARNRPEVAGFAAGSRGWPGAPVTRTPHSTTKAKNFMCVSLRCNVRVFALSPFFQVRARRGQRPQMMSASCSRAWRSMSRNG